MKTRDVIILHGWGLSSARFSGLTALITKKGYRVFTPDLPGFGKSTLPEKPYGLVDYAMFLHGYIQDNHINSPIVIGHSFGGRVSLVFNLLYPSVLSKVVLTGVPGFTPVARQKIMVFVLFAKIGKLFFSLPILRHFYLTVQRWYYYIVGAREFYRAEGVMRETFKKVVQEDLEENMKKLTIPCLLVWGAEDIITPVWIAEKMKHVIVGSRLIIIKGADHGVSFKDPEVFYKHIESFLAT
jgi:pimeloyl-ACP methyl ester carboxylesterase